MIVLSDCWMVRWATILDKIMAPSSFRLKRLRTTAYCLPSISSFFGAILASFMCVKKKLFSLIMHWSRRSHLSKGTSSLSNKNAHNFCRHFLAYFYTLSHCGIHFVRSVSLWNHFLIGWNSYQSRDHLHYHISFSLW